MDLLEIFIALTHIGKAEIADLIPLVFIQFAGVSPAELEASFAPDPEKQAYRYIFRNLGMVKPDEAGLYPEYDLFQ